MRIDQNFPRLRRRCVEVSTVAGARAPAPSLRFGLHMCSAFFGRCRRSTGPRLSFPRERHCRSWAVSLGGRAGPSATFPRVTRIPRPGVRCCRAPARRHETTTPTRDSAHPPTHNPQCIIPLSPLSKAQLARHSTPRCSSFVRSPLHTLWGRERQMTQHLGGLELHPFVGVV